MQLVLCRHVDVVLFKDFGKKNKKNGAHFLRRIKVLRNKTREKFIVSKNLDNYVLAIGRLKICGLNTWYKKREEKDSKIYRHVVVSENIGWVQ